MMTQDEIKTELKMLTANYGADFYKDVDAADVLLEWSVQFAHDDPAEVKEAVQNCISTLSFRPRIADIRKRMAYNRMEGQMTVTEAFQRIYKAVQKSYDRESSAKAYNELQPILQKVVGDPAILVSWHHVNDEAFQTVIMSAIRESYREIAQQELEYYMLPNPLKTVEQWRLPKQQNVALPEPEKYKSIDEVIEEANKEAAKHGLIEMTPELLGKHASRVADFMKPLSEDDLKRIDHAEKRKAEWSLK